MSNAPGRILALTVGLVAFLSGQTTKPTPSFDAATVKRNTSGHNGSSINRSGGRLNIENASLRDCIAFAYGIPTGRDYLLSGPGWLETENFNITATFNEGTPREQVRLMLRTLLAERFHLAMHTDEKAIRAYALLALPQRKPLKPGDPADDGAFIFGNGRITGRALSLATLADRLSGARFELDRPVIDLTGIAGTFDFTLEWAPESDPPGDTTKASLFTALQEQLGLKLEARNVAISVFVVDRVDKDPGEN